MLLAPPLSRLRRRPSGQRAGIGPGAAYVRREDAMTLRDDDVIRDDTTIERVDEDTTPEGHATPGGAAAAGAVTGGVVGLAGGPVGAVIGAVGGAIAGVVTERLMHGGEEHEHFVGDEEHYTGD